MTGEFEKIYVFSRSFRNNNPLDGILAQMKALIGDCDPAHLRLGCPLNNLVEEMSPVDQGFHKRLQIDPKLWMNEMDKQLKRAKSLGSPHARGLPSIKSACDHLKRQTSRLPP